MIPGAENCHNIVYKFIFFLHYIRDREACIINNNVSNFSVYWICWYYSSAYAEFGPEEEKLFGGFSRVTM